MGKHLTTEILFDPDATQVKLTIQAMLTAYQKAAKEIDKAFNQVDFSGVIADTVKLRQYTGKLSGQISYLRMNLGSMKAALTEAFAPIGVLVLPVINKAINRLTAFFHTVGAVMASVVQAVTGTADLTDANDAAAKSYGRLGSAAKRSLASFDQIQRLERQSGGTSVSVYNPTTTLSENVKGMVDKILQLLHPLLSINLAPLKAALENLWGALQPHLQQLGQLLEFLWQAVAVPFITWCVQTLFPVLTGLATTVLGGVSSATGPVIDGLKVLWQALQPVVEFIKSSVISCLLAWRQVFQELAAQLAEKGTSIGTIFYGISTIIQTVWGAISPVLKALRDQFSATFAGIGQVATQIFGAILNGLAGLIEFLAGIFTSDWQRAWNGLLLFLKSIVNSLIGMLNLLLVKLTSCLNSVVGLVAAMKFTVPKWVPGIGGQTFSIPMRTFQAPQIPYLARGAVLPANRPFLAMVGDQKHGTNIEAPLATIQEAVSVVMEDFSAANMAGHSATVGVLQEILGAVLGIEIGDEVIARAANRYNAKMTIMQGG